MSDGVLLSQVSFEVEPVTIIEIYIGLRSRNYSSMIEPGL